MHLLICSYEFDAGAEGICTGRLVRALLEANCRVTLATSDAADCSLRHDRLKYLIVPSTRLPARLVSLLARLGRAPHADVVWCRRVARLDVAANPPDLVYGRAMPFSSVESARLLSARLSRPFWAHLSDPIPSPWEAPGGRRFGRIWAYAQKLVEQAQGVTFTTAQGLVFEEKCLGRALTEKAFVLNHISPEPAFFDSAAGAVGTFAYIGSFYGKRNAVALLDGFKQHLLSCPESRFLFVGTDPAFVIPQAKQLAIEHRVEVIDRVKDVRPYWRGTRALVALDAAYGEPVVLSTKLVEYLTVNRPVLVISPDGSPGAALARRFPTTAILVAPENPRAIGEGLSRVLQINADDSEYSKRFQGMEEFSARMVAATFLRQAAAWGVP